MKLIGISKGIIAICLSLILSISVFANIRSSENYKIESDGISSAQQMSSANYQLFSIAGDTRILGQASSSNYSLGGGTIYVIQPMISDVDTDGDGIPDSVEPSLGLDPMLADTDGDGISDANEDFDGDGYTNLAEIALGSDPADINDTPTDSYVDISSDHPLYLAVELLARAGITEGCAVGNFCPDDVMTRDGMAKWLLRAMNGSSYSPPTASISNYSDVDIGDPGIFEDGDFASDWIEQYRTEGVSEGCDLGNTQYCPASAITRSAAAKILLKAFNGAAYEPPPAGASPYGDVDIGGSGIFGDGDFAADWITELHALGLTDGCDGTDLFDATIYCPDQVMSKAEFANLLMSVFEIQL